MADYVEEKEFTLRLAVRHSFPDDYQGEEDGYEWLAQFTAVTREVVQAASRAITAQGWSVRAGNRGRSSEDEVTLIVERVAR